MKIIRKFIRRVIPYSVRLLLNPLRKFLFHSSYRQRALYTKTWKTKPVNENMVFYEAYHGASMTGNPYAVFTYLLEDLKYQHLHHVWALVDESHVPSSIRFNPRVTIVQYKGRDYAKYLAMAKYLINDTSFPFYFHKREEQVYANIWHGTPLKTMGMDIKQRGFANHKNIQRNFLFTDYLVSPNRYTYEKLLKSHDIETLFNGQVLDTGYPRVDLMYQADKDKLRQQLGVFTAKKVVLYAPTWRGELGNEKNESEKILEDVKNIQANIDEGVVLLKAHYYTEKFFEEQGLGHFLVPNTFDTNEVLSIVDVLITDYSSIFFEFLRTERPVIFYAYDEEEYQAKRGTYLQVSELPGPVCRAVDEVVEALNQADEVAVDYQGVRRAFVERFCYHDDGDATRRFVEVVFDGKSSEHLFKLGSEKTKILVYGGGFLNNGITAAVVSLLNSIDYDRFDVTLIDHGVRIKDSKLEHMRKVNEHVHHVFRFGTWNVSLMDLYRHTLFLKTGDLKWAPVDMYERELERVTGLAEFDIGIDFGGYSPLWAALFAFGDFKRRSIYLHSDMGREVLKKVNGKFPHRDNLRVIFSLYDRFDKVMSVSELAYAENARQLGRYVSDRAKMDYVVNPIDYGAVLDGGRRGLVDGGRYAAEFAGELSDVRQARGHGKWAVGDDVEFAGELGVFPETGTSLWPRSGEVNFITIGRLSPEKDHEKLIYAFRQVVGDRRDVRLYVVGEGALEDELRALVRELGLAERVIFTGQLANPYALLAACDCFVLSSNYEGQAIVLLEALILGKPVITTDIPGPRSVVEGGYGMIVENSVDGLVDGMSAFLSGDAVQERSFDYRGYHDEAMGMFYEKVCRLEE